MLVSSRLRAQPTKSNKSFVPRKGCLCAPLLRCSVPTSPAADACTLSVAAQHTCGKKSYFNGTSLRCFLETCFDGMLRVDRSPDSGGEVWLPHFPPCGFWGRLPVHNLARAILGLFWSTTASESKNVGHLTLSPSAWIARWVVLKIICVLFLILQANFTLSSLPLCSHAYISMRINLSTSSKNLSPFLLKANIWFFSQRNNDFYTILSNFWNSVQDQNKEKTIHHHLLIQCCFQQKRWEKYRHLGKIPILFSDTLEKRMPLKTLYPSSGLWRNWNIEEILGSQQITFSVDNSNQLQKHNCTHII